jgi:hypothetical protein
MAMAAPVPSAGCEEEILARNDFSASVIDRLAKRAGMKCSFPACRQPTSGPDSEDGVTNVGVAAHISAASPGGARYDPSMTEAERSDISNGIWLCQNHAKLIDDDELTYTNERLRDWKQEAELLAAVEARGYTVRRARPFAEIEAKAPELFAEMRDDLKGQPLVRQFIVLKANLSYNNSSGTPLFSYCQSAIHISCRS